MLLLFRGNPSPLGGACPLRRAALLLSQPGQAVLSRSDLLPDARHVLLGLRHLDPPLVRTPRRFGGGTPSVKHSIPVLVRSPASATATGALLGAGCPPPGRWRLTPG